MTFYPDGDGDHFGDVGATAMPACGSEGLPRCMGNLAVANHNDCDDTHASINPGASDVCNGVDDNCDGMIDEGLPTASYHADCDGDSYGAAASPAVLACAPGAAPPCMGHIAVVDHTDCDDTRADIHPLQSEICNASDDNCDGTVDERCPQSFSLGAAHVAPIVGVTGGNVTMQRCPPDSIVVGIEFHETGNHVDGYGVTCATPYPFSSGGSPAVYTLRADPPGLQLTPVAGFSVATYTTTNCGTGHVPKGLAFNTFSGAFYMSQLDCIEHNVAGVPGAFSVSGGDIIWAPFTAQTLCADNERMVGANIYWDTTSVHGVEAVCAPATVVLIP